MRFLKNVFVSLLLVSFVCFGETNQGEANVLKEQIERAQGSEKLELMIQLAKRYQTANNIADGIVLTNDAIALATLLSASKSIAQLKLIRGSLNMDLLNYDSVLNDFNWVVEFARTERDELLLAKALTSSGVYYGITDRFDLAEQYMKEANEIYHRHESNIDLSTNYNNLAVAITGEVKKLLLEDYYTYCQSDEKREDIQKLIQDQNRYYEQSMKLAGEDIYGVAIAKLNIAISGYCYSGDFEYSNTLFNQALTDFEELGASNFVFFTLLSQAQVHFYEGKYQQATKIFDRAHKIAEQFNAPFIWVFMYEYWLPHLIKVSDTDLALKVLYKFYHLKQMEHDQQSKARSENARVLHEVAEKEQAISKLSYENSIKSQEIAREKLTNQFQQVVIAFVVIILAFLAYLLRTKSRSEKLIKEHNTLLAQMAATDPLTGLKNRRALDANIEIEMAAFKRYKRQFSIALLDVDHFKSINDTFGHNAGDKVLEQIAHLLTTNLREGDIACRWGGEEFLILFPQTTVDEVEPVLSRVLKLVKSTDFSADEKQFQVSFTAGIAQIENELTWSELCHKADSALYQGKQNGRSRIVVV